MHDPRLLAIAEAERQLFEADYDDYNGTNNSGTAFCRSAALIVSLTTSKIVLFHCVLYRMLRRRKQLKIDITCWFPLPGISERNTISLERLYAPNSSNAACCCSNHIQADFISLVLCLCIIFSLLFVTWIKRSWRDRGGSYDCE